MGHIHIWLPHKNLCLKIILETENYGDKTPSHFAKTHIVLKKLDMKTVPANLIRMLLSIYFNIPHYHVMLFKPSGHYVNDIEKLSHGGSTYLNFTYNDLRLHIGTGKESETDIFDMSKIDEDEVSFMDMFTGLDENAELVKPKMDTTSIDKTFETNGNMYEDNDNINGGKIVNTSRLPNTNTTKKNEITNICMCNGNLKFESTRVVPQIHSTYFKNGDLLYALPLVTEHIKLLTVCNDIHDFIGLDNFRTFINEVSFYDKNKEEIINHHYNSIKDFLPAYTKHICTLSPHEPKVVNYFENIIIDWIYTLTTTSVYSINVFIDTIKNMEIINNMFTWSRVPSESSPRIYVIDTMSQPTQSMIDIAIREIPNTERHKIGVSITIDSLDNHAIIYIMPEKIRISMGILSPVPTGAKIKNNDDIVEIALDIIKFLFENVGGDSDKKIIIKHFWHEFNKTKRIDKMSFYSIANISIIFNKDNKKKIVKYIFSFIKDNNLGYDIKYSHSSTSEWGYKFTVPTFHMTKKQIRYYFPPSGQRNFDKILGMRDTNNIVDKMPKKTLFINLYNNYISVRSDWTGRPNLNISKRYLCAIYNHLLLINNDTHDVIKLEGMSSEISQLTKMDPFLFSPYGAKGVWSTHCQKSRQCIDLNEDMINLLDEKTAKKYQIERRFNKTTGEKSFIACGPKYRVINKIVGIHPLAIPIYCCTSREHTKGSAGYYIQELCRKNETVGLIDVAQIRIKIEKSIQFSHMLDSSKIKMPGKKYHISPTTVSTYFNQDRIFGMTGLMSPFFHRQSYIFETLMTCTEMQITDIIESFRVYIKNISENSAEIIKMALGISQESPNDTILAMFESYVKAHREGAKNIFDIKTIVRINEALHIFTYNIFNVLILMISKNIIHNMTPQMLNIIASISRGEKSCPVFFVGLSDDGGCYTIYISWYIANAISHNFYECVNWSGLYSSIMSSGQCGFVVDIITKLTDIYFQPIGIYIITSMHAYGLRVKSKDGNIGFLPIGLRYNSSNLPEIISIPPLSEKFTIEEILKIQKCLSLGNVENLYDNDGIYNAIKIDRIYMIKDTRRLPPILNKFYSIPTSSIKKKDIEVKKGKLSKIIYMKRSRLRSEILALIQNNASVPVNDGKSNRKTIYDETLRKKIKKSFYDGNLFIDINCLVSDQKDVVNIIKTAEDGNFIDIFESTRFIFDCEFIRNFYSKLSKGVRITEIKNIITGVRGFNEVKEYNGDINDREISTLDLNDYSNKYAELFTYMMFAETLFYIPKLYMSDMFTCSDYITILDQSIKHK